MVLMTSASASLPMTWASQSSKAFSILFLTLDISFDSLTAVSSGDSLSVSGSMSYDYTSLSTTATLNMDDLAFSGSGELSAHGPVFQASWPSQPTHSMRPVRAT